MCDLCRCSVDGYAWSSHGTSLKNWTVAKNVCLQCETYQCVVMQPFVKALVTAASKSPYQHLTSICLALVPSLIVCMHSPNAAPWQLGIEPLYFSLLDPFISLADLC